MRENQVEVPEPEQKEALGRTERSDSPKGLPGRWPIEPGRSDNKRQNATSAFLSRHAAKCRICNHPDRAAIEFDFLNWRNPGDIVQAYRFRDLSTIYRHAHATGLFSKRRLNLRFAMERIVERVNEVPVTANAVIRAARAITRINDEGQWVDPPSHVIVTHIHAEDAAVVGAGLALPAPAQQANASGGTGSQPVDSPADVQIRSRRPWPIFDDILLDEPSDSASCERPRINGKPPDPEIVLEIAPSLYEAVQARREAANVRLAPWSNPELERLATAAQQGISAPHGQSVAPPSSSLPEAASKESARSAERLAPPATEHDSRNTSFSSLPEAALENSASSALPHHIATENNVADKKENVAAPSSLLPQAAFDSPATACPEQGRGAQQAPPLPAPNPPSQRHSGTPLGSSGSANPPFPFDPPPLRRWKPRRRF